MTLRLATRGSDLAQWQAREVKAGLGGDAELVIIESGGDRDRTTDLARFGSIGIFTVEVDRALLDGRADVGVHSLKDMTTTLEDGIVLAGVLPRGVVEDVLVSRDPAWTLEGLPEGARVGTGSLRRGAMLLAARPDLRLEPIRGNVATRIGRVREGDLDATVLARAGVERLGLLAEVTEVLPTEVFLPAVGQGIVGLTCRADDAAARTAIEERVRDASAWTAAHAEREFLRTLQGGCNAPVGGHAEVVGDELHLRGRVLSRDGRRVVQGELRGPASDAEALARTLAEDLASRGGAALVAEAREAIDPAARPARG